MDEVVPAAVTSMSPEMFGAPLSVQFEAFLDDHRHALEASLDGLTEDQARRMDLDEQGRVRDLKHFARKQN